MRAELDHAGLVGRAAVDDVEDLQREPGRAGLLLGELGAGPRVPGAKHVVEIVDRVGRISRTHQLLRSGRGLGAAVEPPATGVVRRSAAARALSSAARAEGEARHVGTVTG